MALQLDNVAFDCADPRKVAAFWAGALDYIVRDDGPPGPGEDVADVVSLVDADGTLRMYFQAVPEPKTVKNRVHVDLRPTGAMAEEVERLQTLGATVHRSVEEGGSFWTVMRDVEGNEFCVLRGPDDGWAPEGS